LKNEGVCFLTDFSSINLFISLCLSEVAFDSHFSILSAYLLCLAAFTFALSLQESLKMTIQSAFKNIVVRSF